MRCRMVVVSESRRHNKGDDNKDVVEMRSTEIDERVLSQSIEGDLRRSFKYSTCHSILRLTSRA